MFPISKLLFELKSHVIENPILAICIIKMSIDYRVLKIYDIIYTFRF